MNAAFEIAQIASPNCGARRGGVLPDMIVLHYTAMQSAEAAIERLCAPEAEVSAHYVISERGAITQLVDEAQRAWHAGAGRWGDVTDVNSRSIGIELANRGDHPFPEPQMKALEVLMKGIMERWSITPASVIGHQDMAPERKFDPGPRFDWARLARGGLSVWPEARAAGTFHDDAARFGYPVGDASEEAVLAAFRARFRPWASGALEQADGALMADLAERWPIAARSV